MIQKPTKKGKQNDLERGLNYVLDFLYRNDSTDEKIHANNFIFEIQLEMNGFIIIIITHYTRDEDEQKQNLLKIAYVSVSSVLKV